MITKEIFFDTTKSGENNIAIKPGFDGTPVEVLQYVVDKGKAEYLVNFKNQDLIRLDNDANTKITSSDFWRAESYTQNIKWEGMANEVSNDRKVALGYMKAIQLELGLEK